MQYGADLQWLSAFPSEAEVLYPPLSYLQPTGLSVVHHKYSTVPALHARVPATRLPYL